MEWIKRFLRRNEQPATVAPPPDDALALVESFEEAEYRYAETYMAGEDEEMYALDDIYGGLQL